MMWLRNTDRDAIIFFGLKKQYLDKFFSLLWFFSLSQQDLNIVERFSWFFCVIQQYSTVLLARFRYIKLWALSAS
jgi:hypothetical protein